MGNEGDCVEITLATVAFEEDCSGVSNTWLGKMETVDECATAVLANDECSHTFFKHATNGDLNCGCAKPSTATIDDCTREDSGHGIVTYSIGGSEKNNTPTIKDCDAQACLDACGLLHGGSWTEGLGYYCGLGCAELSESGEIVDAQKYCPVSERTYTNCFDDCVTVSQVMGEISSCQAGCQFWQFDDDADSCVCSGVATDTGSGGSDCISHHNGQHWCYVQQGVCNDEVESFRASGSFWSYNACSSFQASRDIDDSVGTLSLLLFFVISVLIYL